MAPLAAARRFDQACAGRPPRNKPLTAPLSRPDHHGHADIVYPAAIPFVAIHLACFAAIWSGVTWKALAICAAFYWLRMFAIGAGYHRYFSHRAFSTGRTFQFMLAFLAQSSAQSSVLWWAAKHRHHHRFSDTKEDTHSPGRTGFFYSHVGWVFDRRHRGVDLVRVDDLARFPELRWLHHYEFAPALCLALAAFLLGGWPGLVVGFVWSTVLVYHSTFSINSLAHLHGRRRYITGDDSRNNWVLALLTMGEGWHNNHHACQASARQGFRWWEVDATYYLLRMLSSIGVVWDLKAPSASLLRGQPPARGRVLDRAARQLMDRLGARTVCPDLAEFNIAASELFGDSHALDAIVERAQQLMGDELGIEVVAT